jgi:hypothetical protein
MNFRKQLRFYARVKWLRRIGLLKRIKCYLIKSAVVENKGEVLRYEKSITSVLVVLILYCDRTNTLLSVLYLQKR